MKLNFVRLTLGNGRGVVRSVFIYPNTRGLRDKIFDAMRYGRTVKVERYGYVSGQVMEMGWKEVPVCQACYSRGYHIGDGTGRATFNGVKFRCRKDSWYGNRAGCGGSGFYEPIQLKTKVNA